MSTENPEQKPRNKVEKVIELPSADMPDVAKDKKYKAIISEAENDTYGRRHWKVHNEAIQNQEEEEDIGPLNTINLKRRTVDLQLDKMVGMRSQIIHTQKDVIKTNFFCELCQISCNDSITWLDHLNGKNHNRLLGMNMKVERVGVQAVKDKLSYLGSIKRQQNERKNMQLIIQKQQYDNDKDYVKEEKSYKKIKFSQDEEIQNEYSDKFEDYNENKQDEIEKNEEEKIEESEEIDEEELQLQQEMAKYGLPTNFSSKKR